MTELWWFLSGFCRISFVTAQPEALLNRLSTSMEVRSAGVPKPLHLNVTVQKRDLSRLRALARDLDATIESAVMYGLPSRVLRLRKVMFVLWMMLLILVLSIWIPGRVFFFHVTGNTEIPTHLILECAADAGLRFGCSRSKVRSESVKNQLLEKIPGLNWVGINTRGCTAQIAVSEQIPSLHQPDMPVYRIYAGLDALITSCTATEGNLLCSPGQLVRSGDLLISGLTDSTLFLQDGPAAGEIFGITNRPFSAVIPEQTALFDENFRPVQKFSLQIGKKRINFFLSSGILYPGCGKMTEVKTLTLPGGFRLPISLICQTYVRRREVPSLRDSEQVRPLLHEAGAYQVQQRILSGEIRSFDEAFSHSEGTYRIRGLFQCHEMIGRPADEVLMEGD